MDRALHLPCDGMDVHAASIELGGARTARYTHRPCNFFFRGDAAHHAQPGCGPARVSQESPCSLLPAPDRTNLDSWSEV